MEEIQAKIEKMVLENLELKGMYNFCIEILHILYTHIYLIKDTIQQNNMAMKKQCETILQWQEDVQRVHDSHKAKFEETKRYIENVSVCCNVCGLIPFIKQSHCYVTVADGKFKTKRRSRRSARETEEITGRNAKEFSSG